MDDDDRAKKEQEKEAAHKQKVNERINRDVDRVRARQSREEGRANAKAERAAAKQKESKQKSAQRVAKWAISKASRQTVGSYNPQIRNESSRISSYEDYNPTDDYGDFNRNPYTSGRGGFDGPAFGGSWGGSNFGSFDSAPFSSGLNTRKRIRSWGPPKF